MERAEFLKMCAESSKYPDAPGGVKPTLPRFLTVKAQNSVFYPVGYKLTFDCGKPMHKVILHDLQANSIVEERLERVIKNV